SRPSPRSSCRIGTRQAVLNSTFSRCVGTGGSRMGLLTEDMKRMVDHLKLCYAATVTPDGKPNLSPKGSMKVWDDDSVVFADIASPVTVRNLRSNPFIEINMVDPFLRRGFRFKGRAEIYQSGPEFDFVAEDLWSREGRQYPVNAVVKVKIE